MRLRRPQLNLSRDAALILVSTMLLGMAHRGMSNLLRPLYVLRLGYTPELFGIWSAMGPLGFMTFSAVAGWLGSRLGDKRCQIIAALMLMVGYGLLPLCQFVNDFWLRILPYISNVVVAAGWSMLATNQLPALSRSTPRDQRLQVFAWYNALLSLGGFMGSLMAGVLPGVLGCWLGVDPDGAAAFAAAQWLSVALAFLGLLPVLGLSANTPYRRPTGPKPAGVPRATLMPLLVIGFLGQAGIASYWMFGTAYMDAGLSLSAEAIGSVASASQIVAMLAALVAPRLSRMWRPGHDVRLATWGVVLALAPVTFWAHWLPGALSYILVLAMNSMWTSMYQSWSMDAVEEQHRAMVSGMSNMAFGAAFGSVSFGGGFIIAAIGYRSLFGLGLALTVIGALWLAAHLRKAEAQA